METAYDIFISFKNSDNNGNHTEDRALAHNLYEYLKSKKLSVFFSESTLQEIGSGAWQKDIKEALKVSKIFIALGTREEYFKSEWVQWERTTFLTRKEDDVSRAIYSYIATPMSTSKLPKDMEYFECFEDSKPNEFERLYGFISSHLSHYFHRLKEGDYLDEETANPYKGLNSFSYDDQANYYGREEEAKDIAKTLKTTRLLTLLGASGSGKSSLIYAGVVPLIEEDGVEILAFRPLDNPLKSLASLFIPLLYEDKLEQLRKEKELANDLLKNSITITQLVEQLLEKKRAKRLYLVIDQFEELFTLTDDKEHRGAFLAKVLELITGTLSVTLLISMRADFLTYLSYSDSLNEVYNNHPNKMLAILKREKLKDVIEKPALALGVTFADGLVEKIIEEIEQEAGQLPLLEFALEQLWRHKKGRVISFDTLEQIGSITQSISHYANSVYERYRDRENSIKRIFLNLVRVGNQNTKKVTKIDEFSPDDRETITLLANERLIVTDENDVEIVHEALIREWQQLKEWINEYKSFLQWKERISIDRSFYEKEKSKKENFLQEGKLFEAKLFLEKYREYIFDKDIDFIEKSVEAQESRRKKRRNFLVGVGGVISSLGAFSLFKWFEADKMKELADIRTKEAIEEKERANKSEEKTLNALQNNIIQRGIYFRDNNEILKAKLLFAEAVKQSSNKVLEKEAQILYNSLNRGVKLKNILENDVSISNVKYYKYEKEILILADNTIRLRDIKSGKELLVLKHNSISGAIISKDGKEILSWGYDNTVRLWDKISGRELLILKHDGSIYGAIFSKNEKKILSWSVDKTARLWDKKSGKELLVLKHDSVVNGAKFSEDNEEILSWGGRIVIVWNEKNGKKILVLRHNSSIYGAEFSKNNTEILSWSRDNTVKLWNKKNGKELLILLHNDIVNGAKFSKNEKEILSWSEDNTVRLWNKKIGIELLVLKHDTGIRGANFSRDDSIILSWDRNGIIKLWNKINGKELFVLKHNYSVKEVIFSTDNKKILSLSYDSTVKMWDVISGKELLVLKHKNIVGFEFSKSNKEILSWSSKTIKIWCIKSEERLFKSKNNYSTPKLESNEKGKEILIWTTYDKIVKLLDRRNNKILLILKHDNWIMGAKFSKNNKNILSWSGDNTVRLWDKKSGKELLTLKHNRWVNGADFSKDEKEILSWSQDDTVKVWDKRSGKELLTLKHKDSVYGAKFNKNKQEILSWTHNKIRLWDRKSGKKLLILEHTPQIKKAKFSKDEKEIFSWSENGIVMLWNKKSGRKLLILRHNGGIRKIQFSQNKKEILIWDYTYQGVVTYKLYRNRKLKKEFYPLEAEVESGCTLTKSGEIRVLNKEEWEEKKRRYEEALRESE